MPMVMTGLWSAPLAKTNRRRDIQLAYNQKARHHAEDDS